MKTLRTGVVAATLMVASFASVPIASAEKCPILVGPDWSGESCPPIPRGCSASPMSIMRA